MSYTEKNNSKKEAQRNFYFNNVYPQDPEKAKQMESNIHRDLYPFYGYLKTSIDCVEKKSSTGAEVKIVDDETIEKNLIPNFTLRQQRQTKTTFIIDKIKDIFKLTADSDFDTKTFEAYLKGEKVCSHENYIDCYNGNIFVKATKTGKFNLWDGDNNKEESVYCKIEPIDFSDTDSYRSSINIEFVRENDDKLIFQTSENIENINEINLFEQPYKINKENNSRLSLCEYNFKKIKDDLYVIPKSDVEKCQNCANKCTEINLSELSEERIQDILETKDVLLQNNRLVYIGEIEKEITLNKLPFLIKSDKSSIKKKFEKGVFVEVLSDSKSIGDLESNVDVFFKETTEKLTDKLPFIKGDSREFEIGSKSEEQNLLEIVEKKDGKRIKVSTSTLPKRLFAVPNVWQLRQQMYAINKIRNMPCAEHRELLELFEPKSKDSFDCINNDSDIQEWYLLKDESYDGCSEQRDFVQKTLSTNDFAFLDGPPGSGKTTVLLELIAQLIMQGKKILLTASTNAAVDNILERIEKLPQNVQEKIFAVRLGNESGISEKIKDYAVSEDNGYREEIIRQANVVCGTIFGILKHPDFNLQNKDQPAYPVFDYLIIDEASKTTFQDFLVPALFSKHWILSGDLKQLTPYIEQEAIQSSLEEIPEFDKNFQRIQTIIQLAIDNRLKDKNVQFYIVLPSEQISAAKELVADNPQAIGIICDKKHKNPYALSIDELKEEEKLVILYGAKLLFIEDYVFKRVEKILPTYSIPMYDVENDEHYKSVFLTAAVQSHFAKSKPCIELGAYKEKTSYREWQKIAEYWAKAIKDKSWAQEITWRLCRLQELFFDEDNEKKAKLKKEIDSRMPSIKKETVQDYCNAISCIALPSILQLLQMGVSEEIRKNKKETTFNSGFTHEAFEKRHTMLTYQHRMHPDISKFSGENIYNGEALNDGSEMRSVRSWRYEGFGNVNNHTLWIDTSDKTKGMYCRNENKVEIKIIQDEIRNFMKWAEKNSNKDSNGVWSIACLTYYKRQEVLLKQAVKEIFNEARERSWYKGKNIEVFIYTVDKFQGREADVVFLSMIKSGEANLGFMDNPNRLNVALTRSRFQRIIVGSRDYFKKTKKSELLKKLANEERFR